MIFGRHIYKVKTVCHMQEWLLFRAYILTYLPWMNLKVKMKSLQSAFHFCSQWHSVLSHQIYILGWLLVTAYQLLFGRGICHLLWWLFLVVTIDCYQCLMILIDGMCIGFLYDSQNYIVTILCFALKHKFELAYYKYVKSVYKKNFTYTIYTDCLKLCMYSHGA